MRKEREITIEELEKNHIYEDDTLWESVYELACDTELETILRDAEQIKELLDTCSKELDAPLFDVVATPESRLMLMMLQFYYLGIWHGAKRYRESIIGGMEYEQDCRFKPLEETPYQPCDQDIYKYLYTPADQEYLDKYAKKILKLLGMDIS